MNFHISKSTVINWINEESKLATTTDAVAMLIRLHDKIKNFTSFPTNFGNCFSDTWDIEASSKEEAACKRARFYYEGLMMEGNEVPENIPNITICFNKSPRLWVKVCKMGKDYIATESSF